MRIFLLFTIQMGDIEEYGFIGVLLIGARLLKASPKSVAWADIEVCNTSQTRALGYEASAPLRKARRYSGDKKVRDGGEVQWNEHYEMRCRSGWEIIIKITTERPCVTLTVDPVLVSPSNTGEMTLYLRNNKREVVGEVFIILDKYANNQSFRLLAEDACGPGSHGFSHAQDASDSGACEGWMWCEVLTEVLLSLQAEHNGTSECLPRELARILYRAARRMTDLLNDGASLDAKIRHSAPQSRDGAVLTVPSYRLPSLIKDLVAKLFEDLFAMKDEAPLVPALSVFVVEKLISIFEAVSVAKDSNAMSIPIVRQFVRTACVWYLQQAYVAGMLCAEYALSHAEFAAIRERFYTYDSNMSGEMCTTDIPYLLMDMGGTYTAQQVDTISRLTDADSMGVVDLSDFLKWWTGQGAVH